MSDLREQTRKGYVSFADKTTAFVQDQHFSLLSAARNEKQVLTEKPSLSKIQGTDYIPTKPEENPSLVPSHRATLIVKDHRAVWAPSGNSLSDRYVSRKEVPGHLATTKNNCCSVKWCLSSPTLEKKPQQNFATTEAAYHKELMICTFYSLPGTVTYWNEH